MSITGHLLVLMAIAGYVYTELCSDLDPALCTYLIEKAPHTCGDPCLSKYCKRSCNICPLQCYECNEIADVSHCNKVVECANPNDYCFTAQTFTTHFTEAYRQGCGSRQTCLQYASSTGTNVGRVEAGCCNQDKCNNKPATLLQLTSGQNNTYTAPHLDTNSCSNQNDDVCTRLSLYLTDPCTDDCIAANICPKMCGKCFTCLNCNEVASPDKCLETTVCGFGKKCYGIEKLGLDFRPAVQLGCIDQQKCDDLQNTPVHIFGKRDFSLAGYCCSGDRCNTRPLKDQITTTTTTETTTAVTQTKDVPMTTTVPVTTDQSTSYPTVPSSCHHNEAYQQNHCPYNYNRYTNHTCYLDSSNTRTHESAKYFCRRHCGTLTSFSSMEEVKSVLDTLAHHYGQNRIDKYYWTDMERDENGNWFWTQNGSPVSSSVLTSPRTTFQNYQSHRCARLHVIFSNYRVYNYHLSSDYCNMNYNQLCKHI